MRSPHSKIVPLTFNFCKYIYGSQQRERKPMKSFGQSQQRSKSKTVNATVRIGQGLTLVEDFYRARFF
jgi:hypothetical protein